MNPLAFIAIRLFALYLIVIGLKSLPLILHAAYSSSDNDQHLFLYLQMLDIVISIGAGLLVWSFSMALAKMLYPFQSNIQFSVSTEELLRAAIFLIGFYFFVVALNGFYLALVNYLVVPELMSNGNQTHNFISLIIQLLISIAVMLGCNGIHSLYRKIQNFGRQ
ncbi:hypothetical protein [Endozoicomonas numazuensis]|uniref:Uncharacterized protein n=1 Tax=Endozoicomonas numazuensis TaxID=1137799 RepID=A0A081NK22_9GAMM|nr:hypothetical protein [Endozoicomonas numazuensis]KEQ18795.1 hypothetical protein GZ78_01530 [Endozoicomonas numazuensis]